MRHCSDSAKSDLLWSASRRHGQRRAQWVRRTNSALETLKKNESAFYFLKPVDKELCAAFDYDLVIEQPMDFETLSAKLNANCYDSMSGFIADMELIFINAKTYNPPEHSVHKAAENLQKVFKSQFQAVVGEYGDEDTVSSWDYLDQPGGFAYGLQHVKSLG